MFRRLQFTFPEGAIVISCADKKLSTLEEMMDSLYAPIYIKLMGTHEHHPQTFLSHEYILLNSTEVNIYKKHTLQFECKSRMKAGTEPYIMNVLVSPTTIRGFFGQN